MLRKLCLETRLQSRFIVAEQAEGRDTRIIKADLQGRAGHKALVVGEVVCVRVLVLDRGAVLKHGRRGRISTLKLNTACERWIHLLRLRALTICGKHQTRSASARTTCGRRRPTWASA